MKKKKLERVLRGFYGRLTRIGGCLFGDVGQGYAGEK